MYLGLVAVGVKYVHQVRNKTGLDMEKDVQSGIDKKRCRYTAPILCFRFLKISFSNYFAEKIVKK